MHYIPGLTHRKIQFLRVNVLEELIEGLDAEFLTEFLVVMLLSLNPMISFLGWDFYRMGN